MYNGCQYNLHLKFYIRTENIGVEGKVSQILYIGPGSFANFPSFFVDILGIEF